MGKRQRADEERELHRLMKICVSGIPVIFCNTFPQTGGIAAPSGQGAEQ